MAQIKGITVTLFDKKKIGEDPFGAPLYEETAIQVDNVLVSPTRSEDIINQLELTGKKAVYTLAIPKTDTHHWENKKVEFFGKTWRTFGAEIEGIDHLIPLDWNKKVMVERYE